NRITIIRIKLWQARNTMDHICHHQRCQRIDLTQTKGLSGIKRLKKHSAETIIRIGFPRHRLATKPIVPDIFTTCPQRVAIAKFLAGSKFWAPDKITNPLTIIAEDYALFYIGHS